LQIVRAILLNQFLVSAEAGDRHGVVTLAGQLMAALRELGRVTGELRELSGVTISHNIINLFASAEFTRLQEGLLKVARAHPGARSDIVALLRSLAAPSEGLAGGISAAEGGTGRRARDSPTCERSERPGAPPLIECTPADADAA
jgi:hypothetical protein